MRAKNSTGWGPWSLPSKACKTIDDSVRKPGRVRNLSAVAKADSITFKWDAPTTSSTYGAAMSYTASLTPGTHAQQTPRERQARFSGLNASTTYTSHRGRRKRRGAPVHHHDLQGDHEGG